MIEAAQKAVAAGDYPAAERLLREAAAIQEATLGSLHPDLASTLNNLAFVCERANDIAEAERGYRRAHAIAVASLGPRDPLVATSIKNLVGFCATHGIPIWKPPAIQPDSATETPDTETETPHTETATPDTDSAPERQQEQVPVVVTWRRPLAIGVIALAIVLVAAVEITTRREPQTPSPSNARAPSPTTSAPAREVEPTVAATPRPEPTPSRVERPGSRARIATPQAGDRAERAVVHGSRETRVTGLAMRVSGRRSATRNVLLLHATADRREHHSRTSLVSRRARAPGHPPSRSSNSGQRLSDVQQQRGQRGTSRRLEGRTAHADGTVLQEQRFVVNLP